MKVFSSDTKSVEVWGPTASVDVKISAMSGVINNTWLLTNLNFGAREIVDVRQCFNDVSVIYALGNNQGQCQMTLTFVILIGRKNCKGVSNTSALHNGVRQYVQNRISQKTTPSTIAIGSFAGSGWLTGIDIGNVDAEKGICYGTVHFIVQIW